MDKSVLTLVVLEVEVVHAEWVLGDCLSAEGALEGGGQNPHCYTLEALSSHQHLVRPIVHLHWHIKFYMYTVHVFLL